MVGTAPFFYTDDVPERLPIIRGRVVAGESTLRRLVMTTKRRYDRWFGVTVPLPTIILLQDRHSITAYWGRRLPMWSVAWAEHGSIFILDRTLARAGGISPERWTAIVRHEHAHLYLQAMSGQNPPKWLREGIPCTLARQSYRVTPNDVRRYLDRPEAPGQNVHGVGWWLVTRLIRRWDRTRLIRLVQACGDEAFGADFRSAFRSVYGSSWSTARRRLGV